MPTLGCGRHCNRNSNCEKRWTRITRMESGNGADTATATAKDFVNGNGNQGTTVAAAVAVNKAFCCRRLGVVSGFSPRHPR
jgi:hypothetical protein